MIKVFKAVPGRTVREKTKTIVARVMFFNKPVISVDLLLIVNMTLHKNYPQALWATYKDLYKAA